MTNDYDSRGTNDYDPRSLAYAIVNGSVKLRQRTHSRDARRLVDNLRKLTWSRFAMSLVDQWDRNGTLTEKQLSAGRTLYVKVTYGG